MDFSQLKIMGILNLTPDSFYDGNQYLEEKKMLLQVEKMLHEGADIIDIGAFSSRPGAHLVSIAEERKRLLPNLKSILKHFPNTYISVDTYRSEIAREVIAEGAQMINDISGGDLDKKMFETITGLQVPYVMMHMQGTPSNMQQNPVYKDVVNDITQYFDVKIKQLTALGFDNILIDPGFGFGKTLEQNYQILHRLDEFKSLQKPVLVGISRKSMLYKLLKTTHDKALNATTIANTIAVLKGAKVLRVHDVKEAVEIRFIFEMLK